MTCETTGIERYKDRNMMDVNVDMFVEYECTVKGRHTLAAEGLALGDLSHEERFFLLKIGRESLILGSR
jgi:hypothetical protein